MTRTMSANFPGTCVTCKQRFPAGTRIQWNSTSKNARHADPAECATAKARAEAAPVPQQQVAFEQAPIVAFLQGAQQRGLKAPKARFLAPDDQSELRLSLPKIGSRNEGCVYVKLAGEYMGLLTPQGEVRGWLARRPELLSQIEKIASDPARFAKEYGALTCRCSFCNLPLTDEGSVEVGYGPICAANYGLPHTPLGTPTLLPIPVEALTAFNNRHED